MEAVSKLPLIKKRKKSGNIKVGQKTVKRRRKERFIARFLMLSLLLTIVIIFAVAQKAIIAQQIFIIEDIKRQIDTERLEAERLKIQIASLRSPDRIEEIAKNELKMILPSEVRYIYIEDTKENAKTEETAGQAGIDKSNSKSGFWAKIGKKFSELDILIKAPSSIPSSL